MVRESIQNLYYWFYDFFQLPSAERRVVTQRRLSVLPAAHGVSVARMAIPIELIGDNNVNLTAAPLHRQRLMEIHMRAIFDYRPLPYEGTVSVFRIRRMPLFSPPGCRFRLELSGCAGGGPAYSLERITTCCSPPTSSPWPKGSIRKSMSLQQNRVGACPTPS